MCQTFVNDKGTYINIHNCKYGNEYCEEENNEATSS